MLTRQTVTKWVERVRQESEQRIQAMENREQKPTPTTLVERVVHHADALSGHVKHLQKELEQAQLHVLYYKTMIRVTEQEFGLAIEKKSATKPSNSCE